MIDLGIAVKAIADGVASDVADCAASCAVRDVLPSIFIPDNQICTDPLDIQDDKVAHDKIPDVEFVVVY